MALIAVALAIGCGDDAAESTNEDASTTSRHASKQEHDGGKPDAGSSRAGSSAVDTSEKPDAAQAAAGDEREAGPADAAAPDKHAQKDKDAAPPGMDEDHAADRDAATPPMMVGDYRMRTLPNGLTLYSARDTNTANVTVQMFYKVGSKDDPAGRSGFAHLFEHLMFKSTRNLPSEALDRLTEDVGGYNNAYTNSDTTAYYEVTPSNNLEALLFAEADRLSGLVVDEMNFTSERAVVEEELRQRVLADPYGRLFRIYVPEEAFQEHPYRRSTIGSIAELEAATLDDVRAFHSTFYRPDNTYLIVIGDFDEKQLDGWVDQYFGPIARPDRPLPLNDVKEPPRTEARSATYYAPNVPLPAVVVNWLITRAADDDTPALTVLDAILSSGSSSRLFQSLTYDQALASEASTILDQSQQAGTLSLYAIMADGKSPMDGAKALLAEAAKLRDSAVTTAEFDQAKHEIVAARLRDREDVVGRGQALGQTLIMTGDASAATRELERIQKITAEDVQRVAQKYLTEGSALTIYYLSEDGKPMDVPSEPRQPATDAPIKLADLAPPGAAVERASDADRKAVPAPGPERAIPTPQVIENRLGNGMRVLVAPQHDVALVSLQLNFAAGAAADPADRAGVANMTATVAGDGTMTKTAPQLASAIEDLGAVLTVTASEDFTTVHANSPSDVFPQAAALVAEIARQPAFAQEELAREQQELLDDLTVQQGDPSNVARSVVGRLVFGSAGYGAQVNGTAQSIPRITRDDLVNFHRARWRPSTATLIVSGDIEPAAALELATRLFSDWNDPSEAPPPIAAAAGDAPAPRSVAIDLPMSGQASVLAAVRGLTRDAPEYYPLLVANQVLGGGFSARLSKEIRIDRGLSYGAYSSFDARLQSGVIVARAQTRNDAAAEVARLVLAELDKLSTQPVSADELKARRAGLLGDFALALETVDGAADNIADFALYGQPLSGLQDYATRVRAVTPEQLEAAAASAFSRNKINLIVVGDAMTFGSALATDHPEIEQIKLDDLNLDSVSLRRPTDSSP